MRSLGKIGSWWILAKAVVAKLERWILFKAALEFSGRSDATAFSLIFKLAEISLLVLLVYTSVSDKILLIGRGSI